MSTARTDTLLRYRPWRGKFRNPVFGSLAMARSSLRLMMRRKLFWALYALAAMIFFFFFYGQYLVVWIQIQTAEEDVTVNGLKMRAADLTKFLDVLALNGSGVTYANFIWFEGYIAMIILALAGAILVGNDFQFRSLAFYLSKPIGRWHYILGKCLGIGIFVNLLTTLPALILYVQAGLLYDWQTYYLNHFRELLGILAYGATLTITLSLLLTATAVSLRRTVPLVMVWAGVFVLCRALAGFLVDGRKLDSAWRLFDLWNDLYLIGLACLGSSPDEAKIGNQPPAWLAAIVVAGLCVGCLVYLRRRIHAVEVIA